MATRRAWSIIKYMDPGHINKISAQPRQAFSTKHQFTVQDVIADLGRIVGAQKHFRPLEFDRKHLESILPRSQDELPPQKMSKSYGEAFIPLGSDETLRQRYLNPVGRVRFGRLLEDLDVFAVWVCYKHLYNPKQMQGSPSPFCIVTALVDQINLAAELAVDKDIKMSGHVSWVGKSSVETIIKLQQMNSENQWQEVAHSNLVMVARDPLNRGSAVVNAVIPETEDEARLFKQGELNKEYRKKHAGESLLKNPPTEFERELIHSIYMSTLDPHDDSFSARHLPEGCQWMTSAELHSTVLCQPENRNRFNKIFGGFIMRAAYELSWVNCYIYGKLLPTITNVDDIWFRKAVEIGSVLFLTSKVVYVQDNFIQVRVVADVHDPEKGERYTTNLFHFTFTVTPPTGQRVPPVVPRTYSEAMLYLDGKRHFEVSTKYKRQV